MPELQPHQQRVVEERQALNVKHVALIAFGTTPLFQKIDAAERDRLTRQEAVMRQYLAILDERIAAFQ